MDFDLNIGDPLEGAISQHLARQQFSILQLENISLGSAMVMARSIFKKQEQLHARDLWNDKQHKYISAIEGIDDKVRLRFKISLLGADDRLFSIQVWQNT